MQIAGMLTVAAAMSKAGVLTNCQSRNLICLYLRLITASE